MLRNHRVRIINKSIFKRNIKNDSKANYVEFEINNKKINYDAIFLLDSDNSTKCVDAKNKQKLFSTGDLDLNSTVENLTFNEKDDSYLINWKCSNEFMPKSSKYSKSFINKYSTLESRQKSRQINFKLWDEKNKLNLNEISIEFSSFINDNKSLYKTLNLLYKYGIVFIKNCPKNEYSTIFKNKNKIIVELIAEKIGYIKNTFYGKSWNVISNPEAKNIAYTSIFLPLHMDLLYYESPPGLQYLHCIKNQVIGGNSIYADSFSAANFIAETDPESYDVLLKYPIPFHYENDGHSYFYQTPLIVQDIYAPKNHKTKRFPIKNINYSPPFQAPFEYMITQQENDNSNLFRKFLIAYKKFESYINNPVNQFEYKLKEGDCVIFMNRRILHSRRQFDSSQGPRWLKGAYSDLDTFYSKYRLLHNKFATDI